MWSDKYKNIGILPNAIHKSAVAMSLSRSQRTPHPGVLFDRERVFSAGGYIENDFPAEDLSLWLRLSREGNLVGVPKVLLNYRVSRTSISGSQHHSAIAQANLARLKFQIPKKDVDYCIENWEKIFEDYDETPYDYERKILFVYDLIEALKLRKSESSQPKNIAKKLLFNLNTYQAGANLLRTKVLKKIAN
jgi:hypothetical protein